MELKVWVEGIQRVVCGVTEKTTCQDVVYALAHATGRTGRFTLIERWRNSERLLAPMDHPLRVLTKWGEHSNDVHFILQRTPLENPGPGGPGPGVGPGAHSPGSAQGQSQVQQVRPQGHQVPNHQAQSQSQSHQKQFQVQQHAQHQVNNAKPKTLPVSHTFPPPVYREPPRMPPPYRDPPPVDGGPTHAPHMNLPPQIYHQQQPSSSDDEPKSSRNQFHGVKSPTPMHRRNLIKHVAHAHPPPPPQEDRSAFGPGRSFPPQPPPQHSSSTLPAGNLNMNSSGKLQAAPPPPPPSQTMNRLGPPVYGQLPGPPPPPPPSAGRRVPVPSYATAEQQAQKNLRELVENQRARMSAQKAELSKFDAEIDFLDRRAKETEELVQQVARLEDILDSHESEVQELRLVEDDAERARRQEKELEARLNNLRMQLSNCESELNSGRGKIQSLSEVLAQERREVEREADESENGDNGTGNEEAEDKKEAELLLREIERQRAASEELRSMAEALEERIQAAERTLSEKRRVAAELAREMRELNLESLKSLPVPVVSPDPISRSPTEGLSRRKIVGSPRQLENAAPTPKNPQGVWV